MRSSEDPTANGMRGGAVLALAAYGASMDLGGAAGALVWIGAASSDPRPPGG